MRTLIALLLAVLAVPAGAQSEGATVDFGFAPPIGTTLRYEIVRASEVGGRTVGARLLRDYRFERDGDGYLLWVELRSVEPIGGRRNAQLIEAAAAPMIGIRYAIEIDANGEPGAIRGLAAVWRHVSEGIRLLEAENLVREDLTAAERETLQHIYAGTREQDAAGQRESLLVVARDLLALASRSIAMGQAPHRIDSGPFPLSGWIAVTIASDDLALVEIEASAPGEGEAIVEETVRYRAAPSSGLVHAMERTRRIGPEDGPRDTAYVETHSLRLLRETPSATATPEGGE